MATKNGYDTKIAVIQTDLSYIKSKVDELSDKLESKYVTQDEFKAKVDPLGKLVYGVIGLILTAVVGGLLSMVINVPK